MLSSGFCDARFNNVLLLLFSFAFYCSLESQNECTETHTGQKQANEEAIRILPIIIIVDERDRSAATDRPTNRSTRLIVQRALAFAHMTIDIFERQKL